jgi:hypothetical protein
MLAEPFGNTVKMLIHRRDRSAQDLRLPVRGPCEALQRGKQVLTQLFYG